MKAERIMLASASVPRLPRHVKLRHDPARDRWLLLAPERVFTPDPIALEVLKLCDGERTLEAIADLLAARYAAPKEHILADVTSMLQDLADKGVIKT
jgi:pyrroloquinoline quinone biosynthesis protein D